MHPLEDGLEERVGFDDGLEETVGFDNSLLAVAVD